MSKSPEELFKNHFPHNAEKISFVDESQKMRNGARFMMELDLVENSVVEFQKVEIPTQIVLHIFKVGFTAGQDTAKKAHETELPKTREIL